MDRSIISRLIYPAQHPVSKLESLVDARGVTDTVRRLVDLAFDTLKLASQFGGPILSLQAENGFRFASDLTRSLVALRELAVENGYPIPVPKHKLLMDAVIVYAFAATHLVPKLNGLFVETLRNAAARTGNDVVKASAAHLTGYRLDQVVNALFVVYYAIECARAVQTEARTLDNSLVDHARVQLKIVEAALQALRRIDGVEGRLSLALNFCSSYVSIL